MDQIPSSILASSCSTNVNDEDNEIIWFNWIRNNNKVRLHEIKSNVPALLDSIDELWPIILHHHNVYIQQKLYINNLKKNSNENDYVVITCDFAENYTIIAQREVQSAHWSQQQVTIFTVHIKVGENHINLSIISEYLTHDTAFVYCSQQTITQLVKNQFPSVTKLFYVSDGAAMHFKNKYNLTNLSFHKLDFDLEAEWVFSATGHGKTACDGKIIYLFTFQHV